MLQVQTIDENRRVQELEHRNAPGADERAAHAEEPYPETAHHDLSAPAVTAQEQLRRLQADFANFRRRAADVADRAAHDRAVQIVALLLPVLDNFERALRAETTDFAYAEGVRLTYRQLMSILTSIGLEPIRAAGEAFDPHVHEAVRRVETDAVPEGIILEELRKGYQLNGALVRPSHVSVAASQSSG